MDAFKLLGSLLGNNATSSGLGGQILGQLIGGLMGGNAQSSGGGGLGSILGSLMGGGAQSGGGGLGSILGSLMGGGAQSGGGANSSAAGMFPGLRGGGVQSAGTGGGLGDLLGSLMGGAGAQGGAGGAGGAGMLGGLVMAALQKLSPGSAGDQPSLSSLAGMLAPGAQQAPSATAVAELHQQALAFVKAMINAAKADGQIDADERQKIVSKLTDIGPQETAFVQEELTKPLNFDFLANVTQDMASQIYAVSLMAITLDSAAESSYMQQLAQVLGLDPQTVNGLHQQLGVAPLYS